jgi:hypothetical protein
MLAVATRYEMKQCARFTTSNRMLFMGLALRLSCCIACELPVCVATPMLARAVALVMVDLLCVQYQYQHIAKPHPRFIMRIVQQIGAIQAINDKTSRELYALIDHCPNGIYIRCDSGFQTPTAMYWSCTHKTNAALRLSTVAIGLYTHAAP